MSVSKLPSGRWRAQIYDPAQGKSVSVQKILGGEASFPSKTAAKQARARAREVLLEERSEGITVRMFWERWTTDPLYKRPKESTNLHNAERTRGFVTKHGSLPLAHVGDLGELDALRWDRVDFARDRLLVVEQYSARARKFTTPKTMPSREAPLTGQAREALVGLPRESEFCFVNLRGGHFTTSARAYHWKAVKAAAGYTDSLYLATRHFAGWYMVNVLEMSSEDVAIALGHNDGGELVRRLYGHRDRDKALDRVVAAYARAGRVEPLRIVRTAHGNAHGGPDAAS